MTTKKTTARRRTFSTKKKVANLEPILVEIDDDKFYARPAIPGAVLLDFISAGSEGGGAVAAQLTVFLEAAFPEEEYARLNERLRDSSDPEAIVDEELIGEIVAYLVEEYANNRPLQESE